MTLSNPMGAHNDARDMLDREGEDETHASFRAATLLQMISNVRNEGLYLPPSL